MKRFFCAVNLPKIKEGYFLIKYQEVSVMKKKAFSSYFVTTVIVNSFIC